MNNYDRRWNFVLNWAAKVKALLAEGYIFYDGESAFSKDEFILDEWNRYIGLKKLNAQWMIFEGNLDFDHGAYTPIVTLKKQLSQYTLMKPTEIDLFAAK